MTRAAHVAQSARAAALALVAALACAPAPPPPQAPRDAAGRIPFVWPRDGVVRWLTCRFETARPIGVVLEGATREETTAVAAALRAWESAGLGVRFLDAPAADAQIAIAFLDEALPEAGRSVADCRIAGEQADLARARVAVARRTAQRALTREESIGVLARELGHALGWRGTAAARDPVGARALADAARVGAAIRAGEPFASPALRALYRTPSGAESARAATPPDATRPIDRLAALARANGLDGPYLRTGPDAGRVFWRDVATGDEYGAQIFASARDPAAVRIALEPRARRALPRSRDAAPSPP